MVTADRGSMALSALDNNSIFDALIVDEILPDMTGLQLAETASTYGIPVLLISGEPRAIGDLGENRRYPFLAKPFALAELEWRLRALLDAAEGARNGAASASGR